MKKPTPKAMPISPNDLARWLGSVWSEMYACASDRFPAVAPSRMRAMYSIQSALARAITMKPINVPIWLISSIGLRPTRSDM
jgi:hypothetical protein